MLRLMLKVTYLLVMGLRPDILSIDLCSLHKSTLPFRTGAGESWSRTSRWRCHLAAPWKYELFLLLGTKEGRTWIPCCSFDIKVKTKPLGNCWSCWLITIPVTWLAAFISNCFTVGTRGSPQVEAWKVSTEGKSNTFSRSSPSTSRVSHQCVHCPWLEEQQQLCRVTSVTISVLARYFVVWLHLGFSSFVQRVTASCSVIYFIKAEKCPAGVSSGPWPRGSSWTTELVAGPKACKILCKNTAHELLPRTATTPHCWETKASIPFLLFFSFQDTATLFTGCLERVARHPEVTFLAQS